MEKELKKLCQRVIIKHVIVYVVMAFGVRFFLNSELQDDLLFGAKLLFFALTIIGWIIVYYAMKKINNVLAVPPKNLDYLLTRIEKLRRDSIANDWYSKSTSSEVFHPGLTGVIEYEGDLLYLQLVVTPQNVKLAEELVWWAAETNRQWWRIIVSEREWQME